jgi:peroxiredoxin
MKRWIPMVIAALGAVLVVSLAWMSRGQIQPVEVGAPAPEISASDLEGTPRTLADYRGNVLLVNIWATWCTPCKAEMPSMQRLQEEVGTEDFQILAVSIDRAPPDHDPANPLDGKLQSFADSLGLTFTILHDPEDRISIDYRAAGVPASFVVDREGVLVEKISGPREWDSPQYVRRIRSVLEGEG